jgi:hypothetical protein
VLCIHFKFKKIVTFSTTNQIVDFISLVKNYPPIMRVLFVFFLFCIIQIVYSDCVMTSTGESFNGGRDYANIPWKDPFQLPVGHGQLLSRVCDQYKPDSYVCCNSSQVEIVASNFEKRIDHVFFRCNACLLSFKRLICDFTCNRDQNKYVKINAMKDPPSQRYVHNFTVDYTKQYTSGLWESCKDNIAGGRPLRDTYPNGVEEFLTSMFTIEAVDPQIIPTYLPAGNQDGYIGDPIPCEKACTCSTCGKACLNLAPIVPDYTCKIYGFPCDVFSYVIAGVLGLLTIVSAVIVIVQRTVNSRFLSSSRDEI